MFSVTAFLNNVLLPFANSVFIWKRKGKGFSIGQKESDGTDDIKELELFVLKYSPNFNNAVIDQTPILVLVCNQ